MNNDKIPPSPQAPSKSVVLTEMCQLKLIFLCSIQFSDKANNEVKVEFNQVDHFEC